MKWRLIVASLAVLVLSGCFTVNEASSPVLGEDVVKHVTVENYGWYLFGNIPLFCGNEDLDSWCPVAFFSDQVTVDGVYSKLEALADREKSKIENLRIVNDNDVLFEAYYLKVPWLVVYKNVCFSANLVKKEPAR